MQAFVCEVCFEEKSERLELPPLKTGNGDVLRNADCNHGICRQCMASFVVARVEEQYVFHIRCPHQGCRNELCEQDLSRLVNAGSLEASVSARFAELRARDFSARAKLFAEVLPQCQSDVDYGLVRTLWETTRVCPRCSLVIEKSEGCNSFYCICGNHFNYESAPRVVGSGIKKYNKVINFAQGHNLPLSVAEKYAGKFNLYAKASNVASQMNLSLEEAMELQMRAFNGDVAARARIRGARHVNVTTVRAEEEHSDLHSVLHDSTLVTLAEDTKATAMVTTETEPADMRSEVDSGLAPSAVKTKAKKDYSTIP